MTDTTSLTKPAFGFSQIPDNQIYEFEQAYGAHHYGRLQLVVRKAQGAWLTTQDERQVLDCLAAYSAANQGHHHPKIVEAIVEALHGNYGSVVSNVVYSDALGVFLKKLATLIQIGRAHV